MHERDGALQNAPESNAREADQVIRQPADTAAPSPAAQASQPTLAGAGGRHARAEILVRRAPSSGADRIPTLFDAGATAPSRSTSASGP